MADVSDVGMLRQCFVQVGRRIYWPGSGLEHLIEYDLFEV